MRHRIGSVVDAITERWIGWTFPPVHRAHEEAQWAPDARDAYCSRCGDSVGVGEATAQGCASCREGAEFEGGIGDGVVRLGPYAEPLRDWILKIKYQRWTEMAECLGRMLGQAVSQNQVADLNRAIVVPMPMPWQRRIYRGIDHSRVLAQALAREVRVPVVSVLAKAIQAPQVTLTPTERRRAGGRGMRVRKQIGGWNLSGVHVLLVDDVRTTGASMKAAVRLLRTLKAERVICCSLAVSDSQARRDRAAQRAYSIVPKATMMVERKESDEAEKPIAAPGNS